MGNKLLWRMFVTIILIERRGKEGEGGGWHTNKLSKVWETSSKPWWITRHKYVACLCRAYCSRQLVYLPPEPRRFAYVAVNTAGKNAILSFLIIGLLSWEMRDGEGWGGGIITTSNQTVTPNNDVRCRLYLSGVEAFLFVFIGARYMEKASKEGRKWSTTAR